MTKNKKKLFGLNDSRFDMRLIVKHVREGSRVLDLGCGDGTLLKLLIDEKKVVGRGLEISSDGIRSCFQKGLSVYHGYLDEGLEEYPDDSFDYVILSQTLQAVRKPELVLSEMLRVGKIGIVTFPNFGYWKIRLQLLFGGKMPKTDYLPFEWHDTPNIHLMTIQDFHDYCVSHNIMIESADYLTNNISIKWHPNLFAKTAIMVIRPK